jgi:hypothetical protein
MLPSPKVPAMQFAKSSSLNVCICLTPSLESPGGHVVSLVGCLYVASFPPMTETGIPSGV